MTIRWSSELELGIPVIDSQHHRIVDYINQVAQVQSSKKHEGLFLVLDELVDYTLYHFAFEENLMDESGYPFINAHKKVHRLFAQRIARFQQRANTGEDIAEELLHVLKVWLVSHIKSDDKDYAETARASMYEADHKANSLSQAGWFQRLFR